MPAGTLQYMAPEQLQTKPPLDRVIRKCLMKDPEERFQGALDLKYNL